MDGMALDVRVLLDDELAQREQRLARFGAPFEELGAAVGEVKICLGMLAGCPGCFEFMVGIGKAYNDRPCLIMLIWRPLDDLDVLTSLELVDNLLQSPQDRWVWLHNSIIPQNSKLELLPALLPKLALVLPLKWQQTRLNQPWLGGDDGLNEDLEAI
jgi:hypothetical protein